MWKFKKLGLSVILILGLGTAALQFVSCGSGGKDGDNTDTEVADSTEKFVKEVCSSCHEFVPPESLPRLTWTGLVLPVMAAKMGIFEYEGAELPNEKKDPFAPKDYYPSKPLIPYYRFKEIISYFEKKAPETLPSQSRSVNIGEVTPVFRPKLPNLPPTDAPLTTFVSIQPKLKKLILGAGGDHSRIGAFNEKLEPLWVLGLPSAPAYVDFTSGSEWLVTCMGSVMPSNKKEGKLLRLLTNGSALPSRSIEMLADLPRPVQITNLDVDGNGSNDLLVNGFGHLEGKLYWLKNGDKKSENILKGIPGGLKTMVLDWDGDGKKDILTMFTQGKESISMFHNDGNGKYTEQVLLSFSPVNGSSSFDVLDVNGDGKKDIVYTCGDNADYSIALKPFHGVYIYVNEGNNKFKQTYFYPIHGCYKALMRDYDLDGDLDIVTISFFADYITQPEEALVYFQNQGGFNFKPLKIDGFDNGRWLTMDAGDLDGDEDEDIVVGNFAYGPESFLPPDASKKYAAKPYFMLLENTTK
ncbi:MAG: VCBS repeat-containing protein [Bacteroidia bacterium]|nr:VCBS repeat-containing protein [Bacteroidia bacterium]